MILADLLSIVWSFLSITVIIYYIAVKKKKNSAAAKNNRTHLIFNARS